MTPQQKLVRLKELFADLATAADHVERIAALQAEHEALLSDVHLPPPELRNVVDPELWARHMAATVAGVSEETAYAWLVRAMMTADDMGRYQGLAEGRRQAELHQMESRAALVGAVRLVLDLIDRRQLRPPMVRDPADPDNPPVTLREHLAGVLRSTGEDVQ